MSLRAQSQLSNTTPAQGQIPSWMQQRAPSLGGGKGQAGSMPQQANPQGMMVQQLLQAMQARRAAQMQQAQQAPAFMNPAQRLAQMPQQAIQALTQAAPQPFFGAQPTAQAPTLPGVQAQQAAQVAAAQQAQQAPPPPPSATPRIPPGISGSAQTGYTYNGMEAWQDPSGIWYYREPHSPAGFGGDSAWSGPTTVKRLS